MKSKSKAIPLMGGQIDWKYYKAVYNSWPFATKKIFIRFLIDEIGKHIDIPDSYIGTKTISGKYELLHHAVFMNEKSYTKADMYLNCIIHSFIIEGIKRLERANKKKLK